MEKKRDRIQSGHTAEPRQDVEEHHRRNDIHLYKEAPQ